MLGVVQQGTSACWEEEISEQAWGCIPESQWQGEGGSEQKCDYIPNKNNVTFYSHMF